MRRDTDLEATLVAKYVVMEPLLNERTRRLWAAAESIAIGFGGDAIVSSATGLARQTIRNGRHELAQGVTTTRIRQPGAGRPGIDDVEKMEQGQMSLEDSLAAYERGVGLYRRCQQALEQAELRVRLLSDPEQPDTAEPFGDTANDHV